MTSRTTLRWRLTIVYGAVAVAVGVVLLLLALLLVDRALSGAKVSDPRLIVPLADGRSLTLGQYQDLLRQDTLERLLRQGLLLLALIGLAGVGVAYYLAGRVLTPLQQITSTARRLSAEQLDARIGLGGPDDELKELADTFDAMLERLEKAFEAQRRFVADASHELRTPLAVMRTEVDVALADPAATKADLRAAALVVRDATERADRLLESLLLLARSDRLSVDGLPVTEVVDLPAVCDAALAAVAVEVKAKGLQVAVSLAPAAVRGDAGLLERLAGNLVENAVRHNLPGGWVRVDTGTVDGRARLQVASTGADVPSDQVEALFEPFRRHGTARTARRGAGLGLAIVRAVATVHGGSVHAEARPGGGLVVTADLPAAADPAP
ncbi:MAG: HAMP domain-containing sensor histidine kinase [Mycobacteriales bacterium]|nr:HAMP domain-containing sensor histidine kinase [Mycobacteriales bacterium]